jgi:hypothetical protein
MVLCVEFRFSQKPAGWTLCWYADEQAYLDDRPLAIADRDQATLTDEAPADLRLAVERAHQQIQISYGWSGFPLIETGEWTTHRPSHDGSGLVPVTFGPAPEDSGDTGIPAQQLSDRVLGDWLRLRTSVEGNIGGANLGMEAFDRVLGDLIAARAQIVHLQDQLSSAQQARSDQQARVDQLLDLAHQMEEPAPGVVVVDLAPMLATSTIRAVLDGRYEPPAGEL